MKGEMTMQISGKLNLFVQDKKDRENKPFKTFSTTISSRNGEKYINISMEVRFNTENIPMEKLNKLQSDKMYTLEVEDGWLSAREYENKDGDTRKVAYIYVDKASVKDSKTIAKKPENDDLPF